MAKFELPSQAGFPDAVKIGKYLIDRLGASYTVDHQTEKFVGERAGRRGIFGRWLNITLVGDMTVIVSNNPLFGTAIRFYLQPGRSLLEVRGIIPNQTLRQTVLPWFGLALMLGAISFLPIVIGIPIFLGWLPLYLLLPRLCALSLTGSITRMLADTDGCRAAGIEALRVSASGHDTISPEQAGRFRTLGVGKTLLGLLIAGGATFYATTQLGRPYSAMLWDDTLRECSIAAGFGLTLACIGVSSWFLRRVSWLKSGLLLVVLSGLCAGAWALVAPQICPPSQVPKAIPQAEPAVTKGSI